MQHPRRLRHTHAMRRLVRETRLHPAQLILPVFVREGLTAPRDIPGLTGVKQYDLGSLPGVVNDALALGIGGVMLFGVPETRDATGSGSCAVDGILTRAVAIAAQTSGGNLVVMADVCLDEFTDHGHCGVLDAHGNVDNDETLAHYQKMATVLADAGVDVVGLSGMMDGQVAAVRRALDESGHINTAILAYAAKYASVMYGPFRNAVESTLTGDRRTYQQDPANRREARREVALDVTEGADIILVKPALTYLDVLTDTAASTDVPVGAYLVSGEHVMVEAGAAQGAFDREAAILETLTGLARAGAQLILTYWALEVALWLKDPS